MCAVYKTLILTTNQTRNYGGTSGADFQVLARECSAITNKDSGPPESREPSAAKETSESAVGSDVLSHECELVRTAYAILLRRRRRYDEFNPALFGEPAWDMLLELYVRETSGASSTAEQLQTASATPSSTAGRWLQRLENDQLIARRDHPHDRETVFVELTDQGRQTLDRYLAAIRELSPIAAGPEDSNQFAG